jgi:hypothetical protein
MPATLNLIAGGKLLPRAAFDGGSTNLARPIFLPIRNRSTDHESFAIRRRSKTRIW